MDRYNPLMISKFCAFPLFSCSASFIFLIMLLRTYFPACGDCESWKTGVR
uniref:Uncharacterized protein n=1 Tax=Arundo donax TaxID=35708 RepID=A0A0A9B011_ARUDO